MIDDSRRIGSGMLSAAIGSARRIDKFQVRALNVGGRMSCNVVILPHFAGGYKKLLKQFA